VYPDNVKEILRTITVNLLPSWAYLSPVTRPLGSNPSAILRAKHYMIFITIMGLVTYKELMIFRNLNATGCATEGASITATVIGVVEPVRIWQEDTCMESSPVISASDIARAISGKTLLRDNP
jgi:hypothetical protein